MKVYQEIDALVTMNIPPEPDAGAAAARRGARDDARARDHRQPRRLVRRRASSRSTRDFIAIEPPAYFSALRRFMEFKDVADGLIKAEAFGFGIVLVCCSIGLNTRGGPAKSAPPSPRPSSPPSSSSSCSITSSRKPSCDHVDRLRRHPQSLSPRRDSRRRRVRSRRSVEELRSTFEVR
jgi:hypothetical protein